MKKFFSAVTVIVIMLSLGTASQLHALSDGPSFSIASNMPAVRGGTITLPITVSNNPGFSAVGFVLTFDPNVLALTGVTAPVADMPLNAQFELTSQAGSQWIHLVNAQTSNWYGNGVIANLTFNVLSTASIGESPVSLAFTTTPDGTPGNAGGEVLNNATVTAGSVNVAASALTFSIPPDIIALGGETVTVPIIVSNNDGFTATGLEVSYDPNILTLTGVSAPVAAMPLNNQFVLNSEPRGRSLSSTQWIHLFNPDLNDWDGNGAVVNMTFLVAPGAEPGSSPVNLAFTGMPSGVPGNAAGDILSSAVTLSGAVAVANASVDDDEDDDAPNSGGGGSGSSGGGGNSGGSGGFGGGGGSNPSNSNSNSNSTGSGNNSLPPAPANVANVAVGNPNTTNTTNTTNPTNTVDDGAFIGNPHTSDNTGIAQVATASRNLSNFGRVPQTGIPSLAQMLAIMLAGIALSVALWVSGHRNG